MIYWKHFAVFCLAAQMVMGLTCPSLYDYSTGQVVCVTVCPTSATLIDNVCCSQSQYSLNGSCQVCNGWVLNGGRACCRYGQYYSSSYSQCRPCPYETYLGGLRCCSGCQYLDMTASPPQCTQVGTGSNSNLTCISIQKIYCPNAEYFYIPDRVCKTATSSMQCDPNRMVCCPINQYVDYVNNELSCVSRCRYGVRIDSVICADQYCTTTGKPVLSLYGRRGSLLAVANNQCCSGLNAAQQCLKSNQGCPNEFKGNTFPVCCPQGQFYNITTKSCSQSCNGIISVNVFCIPSNTTLNILESSVSIQSDRLCNGNPLPSGMTVCCPTGSYINGSRGCITCYGRIFGVTDQQVCCALNEVYSLATKLCYPCDGVVDSYGMLCCPIDNYVAYNTDGTRTCESSCSLDLIQNTSYCCKICNGTCSGKKLQCGLTKTCSPAYFVDGSCQPCNCGNCLPSNLIDFCGQCQMQTIQRQTCTPFCPSRSVYDNSTQVCLDCDQSCDNCTTPFDSSTCASCRKGYSQLSGSCQTCDISCMECFGSVCTTCNRAGMFPVLVSGRCMPSCHIGTYLDNNATCDPCDPSCFLCVSAAPDSCTACYNGSFLQSSTQSVCTDCNSSCWNCDSSPNQCTECYQGIALFNGTCLSQCPQSTFTKIYTRNMWICVTCHPSCISCVSSAINCLACKPGYYLDSSQGNSLCVICPQGCPNCTSNSNCANCTIGFYKASTGNCLKCDPSCASCTSGLATDCIVCAAGLQLINGNCVGCSSACQTCSSPTVCSSCATGKILINGTCLAKCPDGTFLENGTCIACNKTCLTCENGTQCLQCSNSYPYRDNGACVVRCNSSSYILSRQCTLCQGMVFMLGTLCCLPPRTVINNTCVTPNTNPNNNNNNTTNNNTSGQTNQTNSTTTPSLRIYSIIKDGSIYLSVTTSTTINISLFKVQLLRDALKRLLFDSTTLNYSVISDTNKQLIVKVDRPTSTSIHNILQITYPPEQIYSNALTNQFTVTDQYPHDGGLKAIGIICSVILIIYLIACKCRNHYEAQQANRIVMHSLNFCQMVGAFRNVYFPDILLYNFYQGFRFSQFSFFFNIFKHTLPQDYIEPNQPDTLIPDGNLSRNAGFSLTLWIVLIALLIIGIVVIYILFICYEFVEPPGIRLILRLFISLFSLTLLNITFYSVVEVSYHTRYELHSSLYASNFGGSIFLLILIPILIGVFYLHNHMTYFSDQLEHLYSLRETSQLLLIYFQGIILGISVDRYYTVTVIMLEIIWFLFNIMLYIDEDWTYNLKHYIIQAAIIIAYIMLIVGKLAPIGTIVVVTLVMITLIVYSTYQVVGLYYWHILAIFGVYQEQGPQNNDEPIQLQNKLK